MNFYLTNKQQEVLGHPGNLLVRVLSIVELGRDKEEEVVGEAMLEVPVVRVQQRIQSHAQGHYAHGRRGVHVQLPVAEEQDTEQGK